MQQDDDRHTPTPRDFNTPTQSELIPIKSSSINLVKSPITYLVGASGLVTIFLFSGLTDFAKSGSVATLMTYGLVTITYLLLAALAAVYLYSRTDKPFLALLGIAAISQFVFLMTPAGAPFFIVFRQVLPGNLAAAKEMGSHFIAMFFAAGLMEELMKSVPGLLGAWLATRGAGMARSLPANLYDWLKVRGPLDGLLMGVFAGAAFIFIETGFQYFPGAFQKQPDAGGALGALMLLLPRVTGGMVGHMCWAGITGYFIGLAVIRPGAWKYALYAWGASSAIHATWNTQSYMLLLGPLSVTVGGVIFVACLLKARQLEAKAGRIRESYGSIVVAPSPAREAPPPTPMHEPPQQVSAPAPAAGTGRTTYALMFGGRVLPVFPGETIEAAAFAPAAVPAGFRAEVTQHPARPEVVGLKNVGGEAWNVTLRDGTTRTLEAERNLRLAAGVKIDLGDQRFIEVVEL